MTIIDDIRQSYRLLNGYRLKFWLAVLPIVILSFAGQALQQESQQTHSVRLMALHILVQLILAFATVGLYRFGLYRARNEDCHVLNTVWNFRKWQDAIAYIGAMIILFVILVFGIFIAMLPLHFLAIQLGEALTFTLIAILMIIIIGGTLFLPLIIVDHQLKWYKAFFGSFVLIRYGVRDYIELIVALIVLGLLSVLTLGVLLIWVLPLFSVLIARVYDRLLERAKA